MLILSPSLMAYLIFVSDQRIKLYLVGVLVDENPRIKWKKIKEKTKRQKDR